MCVCVLCIFYVVVGGGERQTDRQRRQTAMQMRPNVNIAISAKVVHGCPMYYSFFPPFVFSFIENNKIK